ncbi:putative Transmembrane protein [Mycena sanguinolenta]|uniref:Putative Transmembrane protein n=1 Tax=Mycena sanguinolenta TaxID=230812 RepID=A0A8H7D1Q1_9AGAR|nr:putative Transmembrane protein [Mycena sanguinolenta]
MAYSLSIISLVANGIGFFGTNFTPASCRRFYMLPNVTAMLAGMSVQVLVFMRTLAISGRSKRCFYGLGSAMLLCFPLQIFGITYHRDPFLSMGSCKGKVLHAGEPDWNIVYYSAHMAFDLLACATATTYVILISRVQGTFNTSKFMLRVLTNGLLYTFVVFAVNFWVVLEFAGVFSTGAASTLPLAVVMIAAQHLILSTQRLTRMEPPSDDLRPTRLTPSTTTRNSGPLRFWSRSQHTQQDVEIQPEDLMLSGDRKNSYDPTQRHSNFELEDTSTTMTTFDPVKHSSLASGS